MPAQKLISITEALRPLNERGCNLTYNKLHNIASEGRIPAERVGRTWHLRLSDLDTIAQTLNA